MSTKGPHHNWTLEEDCLCCNKFLEFYVIGESNMSHQEFSELLHSYLPNIPTKSLKMRVANIKQICEEHNIHDNLKTGALSYYSKQTLIAFQAEAHRLSLL